MKMLKCHFCGKTFEVDPENPEIRWKELAVGAALGATIGSVLPGIGTAWGAMIGAKSAHGTERKSFSCPHCGSDNYIN